MRLDPDLKGKIFADASAFVRPTSILQTLHRQHHARATRAAARCRTGRPIPASRTAAFVSIDQLTGILDPGTQAQVQVLLHEAAKALTGREPEIRAILAKVGKPHRRRDAARAGARGAPPAAVVDDGQPRPAVHDARRARHPARRRGRPRQPHARGHREPRAGAGRGDARPGADAGGGAHAPSPRRRGLAGTLVPALDALDPVADELAPTADKLRALAPEFSGFVDKGRRGSSRVGRKAGRPARGGSPRARPSASGSDQIPALEELAHLSDLLNRYRNGIVETAENFSGATSHGSQRRASPPRSGSST